MSSPADQLPPLPTERWWGDHLRETRWQLELYRLLVDPVFHGRGVPRGDGRQVVLLPGFGGGDQTLLVLATWLRRIGYRPSTCGFVANLGCSDRAVERVERRLERAARAVRTPRGADRPQPRRALRARTRPPPSRARVPRDLGRCRTAADARDQLPDTGRGGRQPPSDRRGAGGRGRPRCLTDACDCQFARDFACAFPEDRVRLTSIYSKGDGVVRWQAALVPYGECVEVTGSHVGLIFNRKSYRAIAHALANPELLEWRNPMLTAPVLFEDLGHALATDYFFLREQLTDEQLEVLRRVRVFVDDEVLPVIGGYWERAEMPWPLIRRLGELGIVGEDIHGYGCPGLDPITCGLVHMELNRGDGSLGTFLGVQAGLAMKSIALLGSEEQKQRWLPAMARLEKLGAFALTEPDHGSDSVALETSAVLDGDAYVINGAKRWIG